MRRTPKNGTKRSEEHIPRQLYVDVIAGKHPELNRPRATTRSEALSYERSNREYCVFSGWPVPRREFRVVGAEN